ncbi:hypothetical protein HY994_05310 [Candidatus Micrarchaeota archaeon]|nr:hypothetical protein [Candidatus Micrarchaeota archaeon]
MLRWLLVLMIFGAFWSGSADALSVHTGSWVIPVTHAPASPPGKLTSWLFQNAPGSESVPNVRVQESGGVLTAGLVSSALPRQGRFSSFKPLNPGPSALWLLAGFFGMLVVVGGATWWYRTPAAD